MSTQGTGMKWHAQQALDVQNAVNLPPLLALWYEAARYLIYIHSNASGTFKRHPINVLFMSKVASLMQVGADCLGGVYEGTMTVDNGRDLFTKAYEWCERAAKGEVMHWEDKP